jgi:hypothetical protein
MSAPNLVDQFSLFSAESESTISGARTLKPSAGK